MAALFASVLEVEKKNLVKLLGITSREYLGQGLGRYGHSNRSILIPENERECRTPNSHLLKSFVIDYTQSLKEIIC